jgi:hypothetical protein
MLGPPSSWWYRPFPRAEAMRDEAAYSERRQSAGQNQAGFGSARLLKIRRISVLLNLL